MSSSDEEKPNKYDIKEVKKVIPIPKKQIDPDLAQNQEIIIRNIALPRNYNFDSLF